jgi:hypothetical protein
MKRILFDGALFLWGVVVMSIAGHPDTAQEVGAPRVKPVGTASTERDGSENDRSGQNKTDPASETGGGVKGPLFAIAIEFIRDGGDRHYNPHITILPEQEGSICFSTQQRSQDGSLVQKGSLFLCTVLGFDDGGCKMRVKMSDHGVEKNRSFEMDGYFRYGQQEAYKLMDEDQKAGQELVITVGRVAETVSDTSESNVIPKVGDTIIRSKNEKKGAVTGVDVQNGICLINLGESDGIVAGEVLSIARNEEETEIAKIRVYLVRPNWSAADIEIKR